MVLLKKLLTAKQAKSINNPYVKEAIGRSEWNDRYFNLSKELIKWQIVCALSIILSLGLAAVVVRISTESHVEPFVVETNHGMPYAIDTMSKISAQDPLLVNYAINQFIINARSILDDTDAMHTMLDKVYAYSAGNTLDFLQDYYAHNNPFLLASKYTVSVNIINSMPISKNTWQVIWEETQHNPSDGAVIQTTRWMADITYQFGEVNPKFITDNPFGIYITNVSWSQNH